MAFNISDISSGADLYSLQQPVKPVQISNDTTLSLNPGENATEYNSFLQVVNELAQALKFFPKNTGKSWQNSLEKLYTNLDAHPNADEWNLISGANTGADSGPIVSDMQNFDWSSIESAGGDSSYYDISQSDISKMTPEAAFDLMCSMLESEQMVNDAFSKIFGNYSDLSDSDEDKVKKSISDFLSNNSGVNSHNLSIISYFFNMDSDLVTALNTYWGSTSGSGSALLAKVSEYINSLPDGSAEKTAATSLKTMWTATPDNWTVDPTGSTDDTSWVNAFKTQIKKSTDADSVRTLMNGMMNITAESKYNNDEKTYETKKDDLIYDEIQAQKAAEKRRSEAKRTFNKSVASHASTNKSLQAKSKKPAAQKTASSSKANQAVAAQKQAEKNRANLATASMSNSKAKQNSVSSKAPVSLAFNPMAAHNQELQNQQKKKKVV